MLLTEGGDEIAPLGDFFCHPNINKLFVIFILIFEPGLLYRKCYGEHVGFAMFWDAVLSWLARRGKLPDLEMMVNLGEWLPSHILKPVRAFQILQNVSCSLESEIIPTIS